MTKPADQPQDLRREAIEAALEAHANSPDIVDFDTAYNAMCAAIEAYEQAMWRKEEITDGALLHLIDGAVWYRPLPPPPKTEPK